MANTSRTQNFRKFFRTLVKLLDLKEGTIVKAIDNPHQMSVASLRFSPDGQDIYLGTLCSNVLVYHLKTGEITQLTQANLTGGISSFCFLPENWKVRVRKFYTPPLPFFTVHFQKIDKKKAKSKKKESKNKAGGCIYSMFPNDNQVLEMSFG